MSDLFPDAVNEIEDKVEENVKSEIEEKPAEEVVEEEKEKADKVFVEEPTVEISKKTGKPKRKISEKQKQALALAREKANKKRKDLKEAKAADQRKRKEEKEAKARAKFEKKADQDALIKAHKEATKPKPVVNNNNSKGTEHKPYNFTSSEFKAMLDGYGNNLLKQYDLQRKAEKAEKKKEKPQQYQYIPASGYYNPAPQHRAGPKAYPPNQPRPMATQQVSPDQAYMDELFNVGGL